MRLLANILLTIWTKHQDYKLIHLSYFDIYVIMNISSGIFFLFRVLLLTNGSINASKIVHEEMIDKLIRAPINTFHDTVPKGQILNRLSKDLSTVDITLFWSYHQVIADLFTILGAIVICSLFMYYTIILFPFIFYNGYCLIRFYMKASRDLSRLESISKSPILNISNEAYSGKITIRSFQYENKYIDRFLEQLEDNFKIRIFLDGVNAWFSLTLEYCNFVFFVFIILISLMFSDNFNENNVGLLLTYSLVLSNNLYNFLFGSSEIENNMISVERCLEFLEIDSEAPLELDSDKQLETDWPNEGIIKFVNYSVKYRSNTPLVLKNLNIVFNKGEKIGVVGRTGSGKSTMCLSLFRILEAYTGKIMIDEVDISKVGLRVLRKKLTIIPQVLNFNIGCYFIRRNA